MATAILPKIKREELPAGEVLCQYCTAKCCKYFALPIDTPEDERDWQFIRWYLLHEAATLFKEDEHWYLLVHTQCKHLQPDNRCGIYDTRPTICREYSTENCEYDDQWLYELYLETGQQVAEFAEAILPPDPEKGIRSPKPPMLPVLA